MSDITILLKQTNTLKGESMLDVGTRDFRYAKEFLELGFSYVEALDPLLPEDQKIPEKIIFHQTTLENFIPKKKFDIVVCRHVLSFTDNPYKAIEKLLLIGKTVIFTIFGPNDPWAGKVKTITHEDLMIFLEDFNIRYHSEAHYFAKTYAGDEKLWHVHTVIVKNT